MDDGLFQLIFLALVFVGWLIRTGAEARQRRKGKSPKPVEPAPVERHRAQPKPLPPLAPQPPPPRRETIAEHARGVAAGGLQGLSSAAWAGTSETHDTTLVEDTAARRQTALLRLAGGSDMARGRDLARAGMLWSEILGPCRAMRGPHRPPLHARRRP